MILEKLELELQKWGDQKGQYKGEAVFLGPLGKVSINLSPVHIQQIFKVCADSIVAISKEVATNLVAQTIDQNANSKFLAKFED